MNEREKFDRFVFDPSSSGYPLKNPHEAWLVWHACTEQKDAEIAELQDLLTKALDERDYFLNDSISAYIKGSDDCFKALKESGKLK